jgi:glycosyltransferase involved in cell wall biosynthesis
MREDLEDQIQHLGLDDRVVLCGAQPHQVVIELYQRGTIFVLPCIMGEDGDRDGIPNVILEAMAMGLPVVSTDHSGIPEAVQDGVNGCLVTPADAHQLAEALAALLDDPAVRQRFGRNGRMKISSEFRVDTNVDKLLKEFLV